MSPAPRIAVIGANGHTGRFVVEELQRRGAIPLPATRDGGFRRRDDVLERCAAVDLARPASMRPLFADADAVINCAGPFLHTAETVARSAIDAGIHYLDISAEQRPTLALFDELHDAARAAGVTVVPAMAFYGGLADLMVSALAADAEPNELAAGSVMIAVGLDSWRPTEGTRRTGKHNTFERLVVRDGSLTPVPSPAPERVWSFPPPFSERAVRAVTMSEIVLISRHLAAGSVESAITLDSLADLNEPGAPESVDDRGRSGQRFVVDVRTDFGGRRRRALASGRDIYAVTAPLVVAACLGLLQREDLRPPAAGSAARLLTAKDPLPGVTPGLLPGVMPGVRAPGELFEPRSFLRRLSPDIEVEYPAASEPYLARSTAGSTMCASGIMPGVTR